jgi:PAS domain S-box-containing protein
VIASLAGLLLVVLLGGMILRLLFSNRRSEMILRDGHLRLQAAMASLCDGVIITDQAGRVVFLNPPAEAVCGVSRQEATGNPLAEVHRAVGPGTCDVWRDLVAAVLRGEAGCDESQMLMMGRDGVERPIEVQASAIKDAEGQTTGVVVVVRDDSERRDRERELMEENRRKDEFLAMLSHELRNPLASILTASEVSRLAPAKSDRDSAQELIGREVRNLAGLLDDLMDVSRMTRGKVRINKQRIEVMTVVHRAVQKVQPLIASRRLDLELPTTHSSLDLDADPVRLEQILVHLLSNAAKYTSPGGRIAMTAERIDSQIVLRIIDNGIGIAGTLLPGVFDLFAQGERSLARTEGGLGIGLTIVKKLVELHAGSVSASSAGPGMGSTFTVRLPSAKENTVTPVSRAGEVQLEPPSMAEKTRILIVDDNKDLAGSLARLLRILGHDVEVVFDGRKGIEAARIYRPRVVLLDIGLPNLDGYHVARTLRQEGFNDTMIIALSGYGQEEDLKRSREAGMDHHLTKPVDVRTITKLIGQPN